MTEKQFSDSDAGAIIQRATELHAAAGGDSRLSLEEVEHIAAEMGVPAEHVRAAVRERQIGKSESSFGLLEIPRTTVTESFQGEVDEERWGEMVQRLRRALGGGGETETVGNVRYWNRPFYDLGSEVARNEASVTPNEDGFSITISRSGTPVPRVLAQAAGVGAGASLFMVLMIAGDISAAVGIPGMVAGGAAGLAGVRAYLGFSARRGIRKLQELAHHVAESTIDLTRSPDPASVPGLDHASTGQTARRDLGLESLEEQAQHAPASGKRIGGKNA